ncbi:hypothetical protein [Metabacillus endolithicus]|nr:hypothetical protein [Metabacillus endolithicus]UPG62480.1 hypothetical protein MVE64_18585 [Metabacillus endolithicus]
MSYRIFYGDISIKAGMLFQLAKEKDPKKALADFEHLKQVISFSNKVGAIVCTKVGAIAAIPSVEEVL